ncbi:hypothetical protein ACIHEJ_29900, partial [Streptomyces sp. NPDC052301]
MRDEKLGEMQPAPQGPPRQIVEGSPWGGLSGALVFHEGHALGHVVQHRPHLGNNPLIVVPIDRIARSTARRARQIASALGLPGVDALPVAAGAVQELTGLVDQLSADNDLPIVADLTPYQLGADPTEYGDRHRHGHKDPYLPRTAHDVDNRVREALGVPGRMVILVGPSKAGKTRTAFEGLRAVWPHTRLAKPDPARFADLIAHPRIIGSSWPLVVWLDDLQRYLVGDKALTPARLEALTSRPGDTIVLATLRQEERARLNEHVDLAPGTRQLLDDAAPTTITLEPTSADLDEQTAARAIYPALDLTKYGLAEQLAGAPALLRQYTDAPPLLRAVLQTAIDWQRITLEQPIEEALLRDLAKERLLSIAAYLNPSNTEISSVIEQARTPPTDSDGRTTGQLAALAVHRLDDSTWHYTAYPYLVAHDDGQGGGGRPIPDAFWTRSLADADEPTANLIGTSAYYRGKPDIARKALTIAAVAGNAHAMRNLGWLYVNETSPPDLEAGQRWYKRAAYLGNASAMRSLGLLFADRLDPPDLDAAQEWYRKAIEAGNTDAMRDLGILLADRLDPPDLDAAQEWFCKAIEAGNTECMRDLGIL